ncbi:MAG: AsmA family protein, partial [Rhodoferax sp.]|nr:AsmA family protein [Rhodoferax sp.]
MTAIRHSIAFKFLSFLGWIGGAVLAAVALVTVVIALFGLNWLRAPLERQALDATGRVLVIGGDLSLSWGWPWPQVHLAGVTFANPAWAQEKQMFTADAVDITVNVPQLLLGNLVFPEVRLVRPVILLAQDASGRKNWLLDPSQQDEGARIQIGRLQLDQGTLGFDDPARKTRIRATLSTPAAVGGAADAGLVFTAQGQHQGLPFKAQGTGGPVLALRDDSMPYPLTLDASTGATRLQAQGTVTNLLSLTAADLRLNLRGANLAQLSTLLGVALPATPAYATQGHLLHSANTWRYDKFSGRVGASDIAGSLLLSTGGKRPALTGELVSEVLDVIDLGPAVGSRPGSVKQALASTSGTARVLPDVPFQADNWDTLDAKVDLRAKTIRRAKQFPLQNLATQLTLKDAVLTLDPLTLGFAGGQLKGTVLLDGRQPAIQARARARVNKVRVAELFPSVALNKTSIGEVHGDFDLKGTGNSVARMLGSANGHIGLVVDGGEVSRLMMEQAGLHLWEVLALSVTGDKQVKLRCAVADFTVKNGTVNVDALVLDTAVTTLLGTGTLDLAQETLDLTFNQKTKDTSPLALRSPIQVRGTLARPQVGVDKGQVAVRALGAVALGLVNPLLALLPLIDAGPGKDSDCAQLVRDAT